MADDRTKDQASGVASPKDNRRLEHSVDGATTRDDTHDLGVPMLQGDPSEPQGPEDALGEGPKRGDYSDRVGPPGYEPHTAEEIPEDEREDGGPVTRLVRQRPRASDRGEEAGEKGGVTTTG